MERQEKCAAYCTGWKNSRVDVNILDVVTIKVDGFEHQYIDRVKAFSALVDFKGKLVEVTYHSAESGKLISEFYTIDRNGRVKQKTESSDPGDLNLAC